MVAKHVIKFALLIRQWRDFHAKIHHALKRRIFGFKADNVVTKRDEAFVFEGGLW